MAGGLKHGELFPQNVKSVVGVTRVDSVIEGAIQRWRLLPSSLPVLAADLSSASRSALGVSESASAAVTEYRRPGG